MNKYYHISFIHDNQKHFTITNEHPLDWKDRVELEFPGDVSLDDSFEVTKEDYEKHQRETEQRIINHLKLEEDHYGKS